MVDEREAAALAALRDYAVAVRAYNDLIDRTGVFSSPEYIEAANAMEAANDVLLAAAEALLD